MVALRDILAYELFAIAGTAVTVATLVSATLVGIGSFLAAGLAERAASRLLTRRAGLDQGSAGASSRLVYYLILAAGLAISVDTLGINLGALFAAGAFFAIALGFAMQNITQNLVSGLILLGERTIKPGDIIEVEGRLVKVSRIGSRATVVRTWDAEDYIIPNYTLVSATVKNFTLRDRLYRIRAQVGVAYDSDLRHVREVLTAAARDVPWREPSMDPVILLRQFGNSSVDYDVSVWVEDPFGRSLSQSNLNEAVWFALKDAGITIAFPQLDLHLDRQALAAMAARSGGDD